MFSPASLLVVGMTLAGAAAQPPAPDRPFAGLVANLGRDVAALPSVGTLAALAAGGIGALASHPSDDNLSAWVDARRPASYTPLGRVAGDGWTQAGVAVGTYVVGLAAGHHATSHLGADLIRGQFLTGIVTHALKVSVDRKRPGGGGHSFPSGHTSSAFLTAAVIEGHYGWKAGLPAYGLAGFIGWTRVRDDAHWLTDVIVGGTLGTIVGRTVTAGHRTREWTVSLAPAPGGFAITVGKFGSRRHARSARQARWLPVSK